MRRVIGLFPLIFFICTAATAASDGEIARKYMDEHSAKNKATMVASDSELARRYMEEHPAPALTPAPTPAPVTTPAANKPAPVASDGEIARVKTFTGTVSIIRTEKVIPVSRDEKIYKGDTLKTGADGSLGITFRDNTLLSLGPGSIVIMNEFLFDPAQGKLSIVTRIIKGTAAYLSGIIAKLSPQSVRFETPVATVGFRGTRFLVRIEEAESR
jgi:hypothetical protein